MGEGNEGYKTKRGWREWGKIFKKR